MATATKAKPRSTSKAKQSRPSQKPIDPHPRRIVPMVSGFYTIRRNLAAFFEKPVFGEVEYFIVESVKDFTDWMLLEDFHRFAAKNFGRYLVSGTFSDGEKHGTVAEFFWNDLFIDYIAESPDENEVGKVESHQQPFAKYTARAVASVDGGNKSVFVPTAFSAGPTLLERLQLIQQIATKKHECGDFMDAFHVDIEVAK